MIIDFYFFASGQQSNYSREYPFSFEHHYP
jgi:hypothetical protein